MQVISRRRKLLVDMAANMRVELRGILSGSDFEAASLRSFERELSSKVLSDERAPTWFNKDEC